jgi:predicted transcriptional regulator
MIVKHCFLQVVLKKFSQFNFDVAPTRKAPFDFIVRTPRHSRSILGGVPRKSERNIDQRAEEIMSVSEVIDAQPVFITDGKQIPNNGISLIRSTDLEELEHPEEFIAQL